MISMLAAVLGCASAAARAEPCPGNYAASEPEIAAELELGTNGRFRYGLTYGALDEIAEGSWRWDGARQRVHLTSDPVKAPEFDVVSDEPLPGNQLRVDMELPDGIPLQYFNVVLLYPDGTIRGLQFAADGLEFELDPARRPSALRIDLPVMSLSSRSFAIEGDGGHDMKIRFLPRDLGKAVFKDLTLPETDGALVMEQHDRTLRFHRQGRCGGAGAARN